MDNQHKKIKGYRDLSQAEIDLMNKVKELGSEVGELLESITELRETDHMLLMEQSTESFRNLEIAKTQLQTGFMWLTRAVALPNSF